MLFQFTVWSVLCSSLWQWCINLPSNSSWQLPFCCAPPVGMMVTLYSPLSLTVRLLSSRDPVDLWSFTRPVYAGPTISALVEVIILTLEPWLFSKLQVTIMKGISGGVTVVVNVTVSPTMAVRLSGSTPAPWVTPGGDRHRSLRGCQQF